MEVCGLSVVVAKDGREYIISACDSTFALIGDTQEEDRRQIADLVSGRMQVGIDGRSIMDFILLHLPAYRTSAVPAWRRRVRASCPPAPRSLPEQRVPRTRAWLQHHHSQLDQDPRPWVDHHRYRSVPHPPWVPLGGWAVAAAFRRCRRNPPRRDPAQWVGCVVIRRLPSRRPFLRRCRERARGHRRLRTPWWRMPRTPWRTWGRPLRGSLVTCRKSLIRSAAERPARRAAAAGQEVCLAARVRGADSVAPSSASSSRSPARGRAWSPRSPHSVPARSPQPFRRRPAQPSGRRAAFQLAIQEIRIHLRKERVPATSRSPITSNRRGSIPLIRSPASRAARPAYTPRRPHRFHRHPSRRASIAMAMPSNPRPHRRVHHHRRPPMSRRWAAMPIAPVATGTALAAPLARTRRAMAIMAAPLRWRPSHEWIRTPQT